MTDEERFMDTAMRLPIAHRVRLDDGDGWRQLSPREICLLVEIFEDAQEGWLSGGPIEELGITLGVLKERESHDLG